MSDERERRPGGNGTVLGSSNLKRSTTNNRETPEAAQARDNSVSTLDRVKKYIQRGFAPVPVPLRKKGPVICGWQNLRITQADAPKHFNRTSNIGIILGEASGGLVDIDLDCLEAIDIADKTLPTTDAIFGRSSKPKSHRLYRVPGAAASLKFKDPVTDDMLLELRGDGGWQTVFPGSIHPSGELIEWETEGDTPIVDYAVIVKDAKKLAARCLIKRYCSGAADYTSLLTALDTADSRVADKVCEWLGLSGCPSADCPTTRPANAILENRSAEASPLRPNYLQGRESRRVAERTLQGFARSDLKDCVRELQNQKKPGRMGMLFRKAIRSGVMIARGEIDQTEVVDALFEACISNGLVGENGERDVRRTIENGLKTGASKAQESPLAPTTLQAIEQQLRVSATPFVACDPAKIPPRRFLYGRHYIRKYVTATVSAGGIGKSASALVEAISMAIGCDLLDSNKKSIGRLRVWYWNGEDPKDEIERRIHAVCLHFKIDSETLEGWLFIDSGHDMPICVAKEDRGTVAFGGPTINQFSEAIERKEPASRI